LYGYYAVTLHDEKREGDWLELAAVLRHPEAERWLAYRIRSGEARFKQHGASPQEAVENLLRDACEEQGGGSSCYDLAEALETGYFGVPDPSEARAALARGAELGNRMCWTRLARWLNDGVGGPVDAEQAYYWISLEARCVDPRSGEETWTLRNKLAERLTPSSLERQWVAVDSYMAEFRAGKRTIYFDPFLGSAIGDEERKDGQRLANRAERKHRESLRRIKGAP
jgi:hypothetical protein